MRVGFAGTPEFAAIALQALLDAGVDIPLALTQPDRPAGRGMKLMPSAVKVLAQQHSVAVAQPTSLRLDGKYPEEAAVTKRALEAANLDVLVVVAYGLILPQWVLNLPRLGCLNIHASLLPKWRGAAPIHRAIEAGDSETGVCIMQMDAGLDTGAVLLREALPMTETDTTATLHDKLAALGARLIVDTVQALSQAPQSLTPVPQDHTAATYAHKISKAESAIDWSQSAAQIARKIRALNPAPGCTTALTDVSGKVETVKLWHAHAQKMHPSQTLSSKPLGQVVVADRTGIGLQAGDGLVVVTELQRAGGKRLSAEQFLSGFSLRALDGGYDAMAKDAHREQEAKECANALSKDLCV